MPNFNFKNPKWLSLCLLFLALVFKAQTAPTVIYFRYDEAGSQGYRGPNISEKAPKKAAETAAAKQVKEEKEVFKKDQELKIYPIPVKDVLFVEWADKLSQEVASVQIYNLAGIIQYFNQDMANANPRLEINTSQYATGVYMVNILLKNGEAISKKIIKE